jgi:uncharacterized protein
MRWLQIPVAILVLLGASSCAPLDHLQRELIFRPVTEDWTGYSPGILRQEEVRIPVGAGGEELQGWWLSAPGAIHTIVYFHGARVNLSGSVYRLRAFRGAGYNVLAIDYRGFGRSSPAVPSEQSVYEDAEAAWKWLDARAPVHGRRILYGHSLGGPIAAELALRTGTAAALVLESTFPSIREVAAAGFWRFLPLDRLLTQRLDLADKLARLSLPVVIVHGAHDEVVPPAMARRLYELARAPKRLLLVEGAGHRWVAFHAGDALYRELQDFLRETQPASR